MALASALVPLGTPAPEFALASIEGRSVRLSDFAGNETLVVAFVCNHCPYVKHIEQRLGEVAAEIAGGLVAISSNDASRYPDDAPAGLCQQAQRAGWGFPYLVDSEQTAARDFGAVCTPDFFVYGPERRLVYRGAFDAATPGNNEPVDGHLLSEAVRLAHRGKPVPEPHRPSMGCGIKWLPGKEPQ